MAACISDVVLDHASLMTTSVSDQYKGVLVWSVSVSGLKKLVLLKSSNHIILHDLVMAILIVLQAFCMYCTPLLLKVQEVN